MSLGLTIECRSTTTTALGMNGYTIKPEANPGIMTS